MKKSKESSNAVANEEEEATPDVGNEDPHGADVNVLQDIDATTHTSNQTVQTKLSAAISKASVTTSEDIFVFRDSSLSVYVISKRSQKSVSANEEPIDSNSITGTTGNHAGESPEKEQEGIFVDEEGALGIDKEKAKPGSSHQFQEKDVKRRRRSQVRRSIRQSENDDVPATCLEAITAPRKSFREKDTKRRLRNRISQGEDLPHRRFREKEAKRLSPEDRQVESLSPERASRRSRALLEMEDFGALLEIEGVGVEPLPFPAPAPQSLPGAYARPGRPRFGALHVPGLAVTADTDDQPTEDTSRALEDEWLISANPVDAAAGNQLGLPLAVPDDTMPEHLSSKSLFDPKSIAAILCMVTSAIMIIAGLVVVALLPLGGNKQGRIPPTDSPSIPPSQAPTSQAVAWQVRIESILPSFTLQTLDDPDRPQAKAFEWLMGDSEAVDLPDWRIQQRFALATLFFATNGHRWFRSDHWLSYTVHECHWFSRNNATIDFGDISPVTYIRVDHPNACEEDPQDVHARHHTNRKEGGILKHLLLYENQMKGGLPPEISLLSGLRSVFLHINQISGSLPTQIGSLSQLEVIAMAGNQLQGSLPVELTRLSNSLTAFVMYNNLFTGSVPSFLGSFPDMRYLLLDFNSFIGTIPTELAQLQRLVALYLSENDLTGSVPSQVGLFPPTLVELFLFSNELTGSIPTEVGLLSKMERFALDANKLTGTLPHQIANMESLSYIWMNHNFFTGTIPTQLATLPRVYYIYLYSTLLTGQIPSEILTMPFLQHFWCQSNHMTGSIPTEVGLASNMQSFSAFNNLLTGEIPTQLGQLNSNLGELRLHHNNLKGTIPQELGNLSASLWTLVLSGNELEGSIPDSWYTLELLTWVELNDNQLTGTLMTELGLLVYLKKLQLQNNPLLHGSLPSEIVSWQRLEVLDISGTSLSGNVPDKFCGLESGLGFDCSDTLCGCGCPCQL